jgi:hypothetical protein
VSVEKWEDGRQFLNLRLSTEDEAYRKLEPLLKDSLRDGKKISSYMIVPQGRITLKWTCLRYEYSLVWGGGNTYNLEIKGAIHEIKTPS